MFLMLLLQHEHVPCRYPPLLDANVLGLEPGELRLGRDQEPYPERV